MFDFERIFVCRRLKVGEDGYNAEGIGFSHSAEVQHLLFFGHVLGARLPRDVHVYLEIEQATGQEVGPLLQQTYRLIPGSHPEQRLFLAIVPVRGLLDAGRYQAIINIEHWVTTRVGLEIV